MGSTSRRESSLVTGLGRRLQEKGGRHMTPARWLRTAVALLLLGAVTAVTATGASGRPAAETFADPAGDGQGAPDITAIVIDDDATTGTITFAMTVAGFPQGGESDVVVWLDLDQNPDTGDPEDGTEYALAAGLDADGYWWDFGKWTGSWHSVHPSPTMHFSRAGDVHTWTLNRSDLGAKRGFDFYAVSSLWALGGIEYGDDGPSDWAPDGDDWWTYDLSTAPPAAPAKPVIGKPKAVPPTPTAGKRFTVSFAVTRSDNGEPLTSGRMICDPSVVGKTIRHAESFKGGTARLSFVVPRAAKGKLLKVKVTIKNGYRATTKIATFKVR
jgi:hypothetical protein